MSHADTTLESVVDDVLRDAGPASALAVDGRALPKLWAQLCGLGWPLVGIDESAGGVGGGLDDLATLVAGTGRHTAAVPLLETATAAWLLCRDGRAVDVERDTPALVVDRPGMPPTSFGRPGAALSGRWERVPWASTATLLVVVTPAPAGKSAAALVRPDQAGVTIERGVNLADEPRDTVVFDGVEVPADDWLDDVPPMDDVWLRAATLRAVATVGAMAAAAAAAGQHARAREQFGRPLARFQAVAAHLARMAGAVALARVAAARGVASVISGNHTLAHVAASRVVVARGATDVARRAHQVHAAMGITREHHLQLATRRLWSWRDEYGSERWWSERLAGLVAAGGSDGVWDVVTDQTRSGGPSPAV